MSACFPTQNTPLVRTLPQPAIQGRSVVSTPELTQDTPAPSVIFRWWRQLAHRYCVRRQQKIDRDAFLTMLSLDDSLLNDIGVTRSEVRWAANLPLSEDAAVALRESACGARR
ncbi:MAG: hypothetical protein AB8B64_24050 [Granulosicoccus sp.]